MDHSNFPPPIFIIGAQRSGTTLLRLMLNAHSEVAIPEEGTFWMPMLRKCRHNLGRKIKAPKLRRYFRYLQSNTQFKLWGMNPGTVFEDIKKNGKECTLATLMSAFYTHYTISHNKAIWGDKTPSFFRMIAALVELFPDARFIHIIRDGRDLFLSWRKIDPSKRNISVSAMEWVFKVRRAKRALNALHPEQHLEMKYEDLVSHPEEALGKICQFIGVQYEPNMLNYWRTSSEFIGPHHSDLIFGPVSRRSAGRWKSELSQKEIRNFEFIAKTTLASLGYELAHVDAQNLEAVASIIFQLAYGLPLRAGQVLYTSINLNVSARFGLSTEAAGKGRPPKLTNSRNDYRNIYTVKTGRRNLKVLFANKFFFLKGGSERVFFQERDFLIENGIEVVDFSMEDSRNVTSDYSSYFVSGVDYHDSRGPWNKLRQAAKFVHSTEAVNKLERLVENEKPDIAHLHNIYHQLTPSIISVLKRKGVKVLLTLHDGKLICPSYLMLANGKVCTACKGRVFWKPLVTNCASSRGQELVLMLEAYWHKWAKSYESVNLFLSPSLFLADLVSQTISQEKIRVLHNGIDLNDHLPSIHDRGYALYLGRLSREKGIETLLRAHENVANEITLKVVGSGPLESNLKGRYQRAEFLGYRSGEELKEIVTNSGFVVVPSEWYENCPMVVLEAMATGKPVVGSSVGGIPEQIEDGTTGFLFDMGNWHQLAEKMKLLAENPEMRKRMGRAARKKVEEEYSLDAHCTKLMKIYEELLSKN